MGGEGGGVQKAGTGVLAFYPLSVLNSSATIRLVMLLLLSAAVAVAAAAVGFTYELCAGIIDKPGLDLKQITREEVGG